VRQVCSKEYSNFEEDERYSNFYVNGKEVFDRNGIYVNPYDMR